MEKDCSSGGSNARSKPWLYAPGDRIVVYVQIDVKTRDPFLAKLHIRKYLRRHLQVLHLLALTYILA